MRKLGSIFLLNVLLFVGSTAFAQKSKIDSNRLTYLDAPCDPYYVGRGFPKLTTPQWLGEPGVEAVIVLAIDDMRDSPHYENYLRPILDRLKEIDGRAGLSIMTNRASDEDEQLQEWLKEGVSLEVHTYDHPCPCLKDGDFAKAKETYDRCVDLMFSIPGNQPVAYRMPCCDSLNTPSPRFWSEVIHRRTPQDRFLSIDSSVFHVFTPADPELPGDLLIDTNGERKFRKYLPFPSFVNTIEDYPYPYVIGRMSWEFPCMVPSDWEAQNIQGPNNPKTVEDLKTALDLTVLKQGVFNLVFHPHGWMRNEQVVELIDHAVEQHGSKVKFLSFREAHDRLNQFLLAGQPLRDPDGWDNGVRLLDVNHDGYLDVVIGNSESSLTRIWDPSSGEWRESAFPLQVAGQDASGSPAEVRTRFGTDTDGNTIAIGENPAGEFEAHVFRDQRWQLAERWQRHLDELLLHSSDPKRPLNGAYLRDVDGFTGCEILISRSSDDGNVRREIWANHDDESWSLKPYFLPKPARLEWNDRGENGVRFVDLDHDGDDDLVISNEREFAVYLYESDKTGWAQEVRRGNRGDPHPIPMISRDGKNNGAWFHSDHLWIQNEGTHRLPDLVDRISFAELRQPPQDEVQPEATGIQPEVDGANLRDNLPRPLSPTDAVQTLKTRPELKIELVASEPLVRDPVAFDWGPDGELWVAEMGDYPLGSNDDLDDRIQLHTDERNAKGSGRIRLLRDTDDDGIYDQSTVFLDGISFPTAIKFWRNGVYVMAAPDLLFAIDSDGDDRADSAQVKLTGFEPGNQQHRANGLRWGLDGWLHIANGDSGGTIQVAGSDEGLNIRGFDLIYHPIEERIERTTGQTQFGRNRDDWGNWFGGNNSNPMWQYVLDERDIGRNPFVATPSLRHIVPRQAGNAPVFPISVTLERFNDLHTANRITSACSPMVFRAPSLGDEFYGNAFVCEPVHNLVHREVIRAQGSLFTSERASDEQRSEFLASTDSWFRPVMARTGPDGALWIADMYRLVIEHPEWIPTEWQERLDLRAGSDRGRIYRVVSRDNTTTNIPRMSGETDDQLIKHLLSTNGTIRDLAQQMLIWRNYRNQDAMRMLLETASTGQSRLQILYTMSCLGLLDEGTLSMALADSNVAVRRGAIRLVSRVIQDGELTVSAELLAKLIEAVGEQAELKIELATSLASFPYSTATQWMAEHLSQPTLDPFLRAALFSSITSRNIESVLERLWLRTGEQTETPDDSIFRDLIQSAVGLKKTEPVVRQISERWSATSRKPNSSRGLSRLAAMMSGLRDADESEELQSLRASMAETAIVWALNEELQVPQRVAAMRLLSACGSAPPELAERLALLLSIQEPLELQVNAVELIATVYPKQLDLLLRQWRDVTPRIRELIISSLLRDRDGSQYLINAIEENTVSIESLSAAQLQQLLLRANETERKRLHSFALNFETDRASLINSYSKVVQMSGDIGRGREVFKRSCSNCHRLGDLGQSIGPDLRSLTDRSKQAMITAILDPNRAVEDKYIEYAIITTLGRQYSGMLLSESSASLQLATAEGKRIDILRSDIETIGASNRSLMPEGLEKDLDAQQMADVIAYVTSQQLPPKIFEGNQPRLIKQNTAHAILLPAEASRIYGPSLVFERQYKNLGWWSSAEDYAIWDLEVEEADTYEVIFEYAAHASAAGDRFVLTIADQVLRGQVMSTGTWDDYQVHKFGRIQLEPGRYELVIRSDGPIRQAMIDLKEVQLLPFLLNE